jgi:hypothetical protein
MRWQHGAGLDLLKGNGGNALNHSAPLPQSGVAEGEAEGAGPFMPPPPATDETAKAMAAVETLEIMIR